MAIYLPCLSCYFGEFVFGGVYIEFEDCGACLLECGETVYSADALVCSGCGYDFVALLSC